MLLLIRLEPLQLLLHPMPKLPPALPLLLLLLHLQTHFRRFPVHPVPGDPGQPVSETHRLRADTDYINE